MNLCVIPARGGSKRVPRKNIKFFAGKPMIAYAIEAAQGSGLFDHILVSTDDGEIAEIAQQWGVEVPFKRPPELADDHTPTVPVIAHAIRECEGLGWQIDKVCCIYPCVPFIQVTDLKAALDLLQQSKAAYSFPITEFPFPELARRFGTLSGLSDHTLGTTASVAAVALGACVIEKHFTLSRADKGPDSEFSLEPDDLEHLCRDAKDAWLALGKPGFERQRAEEGSKVFRRSLYFVKDLPAGHVITPEDIRRIRPGMGLAPKYFDQVVGSRLSQAVKRGTPVNWDSMVSKGE